MSHTFRVRTGAQDSGSPPIGLNSPVSSMAAIPAEHKQSAMSSGWSPGMVRGPDGLGTENSEMIRTACDSFGSVVWGPSQSMAAAKMQKIT